MRKISRGLAAFVVALVPLAAAAVIILSYYGTRTATTSCAANGSRVSCSVSLTAVDFAYCPCGNCNINTYAWTRYNVDGAGVASNPITLVPAGTALPVSGATLGAVSFTIPVEGLVSVPNQKYRWQADVAYNRCYGGGGSYSVSGGTATAAVDLTTSPAQPLPSAGLAEDRAADKTTFWFTPVAGATAYRLAAGRYSPVWSNVTYGASVTAADAYGTWHAEYTLAEPWSYAWAVQSYSSAGGWSEPRENAMGVSTFAFPPPVTVTPTLLYTSPFWTVRLTWPRVTNLTSADPGAHGVSKYSVVWLGGLFGSTTFTTSCSTPTCTYDVGSIMSNTAYAYTVVSANVQNINGTDVEFSTSPPSTGYPTPPEKPLVSVSNVTPTGARLTMTTPGGGATGYNVKVNGALVASNTTSPYDLTGLAANTVYSVYTAGRNGSLVGPETLTTVSTTSGPMAFSSITGGGSPPAENFQWVKIADPAGAGVAVHYDVIRLEPNGVTTAAVASCSQNAAYNGTPMACSDSGLAPNTVYGYKLFATTTAGQTPDPGWTMVTTVPAVPTLSTVSTTSASFTMNATCEAGATSGTVLVETSPTTSVGKTLACPDVTWTFSTANGPLRPVTACTAYKARAQNQGGSPAGSTPTTAWLTVRTQPLSPAGLAAAVDPGSGNVKLSWTMPTQTCTGETPSVTYQHRATNGDPWGSSAPLTPTCVGSACSFLTGDSWVAAHQYRLFITAGAYGTSDASNTATNSAATPGQMRMRAGF